MAHLKLNGLTIPVQDMGMREEEIGDRSESFAGNPLTDRRAFRRVWNVKTTVLTEAEYNLMSALVAGKGQIFTFDSKDEWSSKGVGPANSTNLEGGYVLKEGEVNNDDTGVYDAYDQNGKIEAKSDGAAIISDAQTPDVASNVITGGDTNDDATGFAALGGSTVSRETDLAWRGTGCIKVETNGADTGTTITPTTMTLDVNYLATFYVFSYDTDTIRVRYKGDASTESWNDVAITADRWNRIAVQDILPDPGGGNANPKIDIASAGDKDFYLDGVFTVDSFAGHAIPPWAAAAYAANDWRIPNSVVAGFVDFTFAAWVKHDWNDVDKAAAILIRARYANYAGGNLFAISRDANDNNLLLSGYDYAGNSYSLAKDPVFTDQDWHHVAAVFRRDPVAGGNGVELWVDGVMEDSSTTRYAPDFTSSRINLIGIGNNTGTSNTWFGAVDEMIFFPAALSSEMITALQTQTWAALPKLRATGDFIYESYVEVVPKIKMNPYQPAMNVSTWDTKMRRLEFELRETV